MSFLNLETVIWPLKTTETKTKHVQAQLSKKSKLIYYILKVLLKSQISLLGKLKLPNILSVLRFR